MKIIVDEGLIVDVDPSKLDRGDHYEFPCGCRFPIREDLPPVNGHKAIEYDMDNVSLDCSAVWGLLSTGRTKGVFQLESNLGRHWAKRLKPENIEHLSALTAILRPGCLKSQSEDGVSMTELYCRRKNGEAETVYVHPSLESILGSTYGILVFQEQAMQIAQELAGFNLQEADVLRKAIGKKSTELMSQIRVTFAEKAKGAGVVDEETAQAIFENIQKSQRYSFNKCVSFDTKILRRCGGKYAKRAHFTVEEMYKIRYGGTYAFHNGHAAIKSAWKKRGHFGSGLSLNDQGRVKPNIIRDIQPAGVQEVYRVSLENGSSIKVTLSHKFPTPNGEKELGSLGVGDYLYVAKPFTPDRSKIRYSDKAKKDLVNRKPRGVNPIAPGKRHWNYTNGSWSSFVRNKLLLRDECAECGRSDLRLDTHHKDGDRSNSRIENLEKLCRKCHMRKSVSLGQMRNSGDVGYEVEEVVITSIEPVGQEMTYDVTMDGPWHNFVVEGDIVTSNSHSVAYSLNAYLSAHWKVHFPLEFFTSFLMWSKDKGDPTQEVRQLINEMRHFGFRAKPPRFEDLRPHFYNDGESIYFGLADVKHVGEKVVEKMREEIPAVEGKIGPRSQWTWWDFLREFSGVCGKTATTKFIESGALDRYGVPRQRMLYEFATWEELTEAERKAIGDATNLIEAIERILTVPIGHTKGTKSVPSRPKYAVQARRRPLVESKLELLRNPPYSLEDTTHLIATGEEENLGVALTTSHVASADRAAVNCTVQEFLQGKLSAGSAHLVLGVEVQEAFDREVRNGDNRGRKMATLVVADETGVLEDVVCFPDAFEGCGHILMRPGAVVALKGKPHWQEPHKFIVEEAWDI